MGETIYFSMEGSSLSKSDINDSEYEVCFIGVEICAFFNIKLILSRTTNEKLLLRITKDTGE